VPNVARLEAGDHEPSLTTLARLSGALGRDFSVVVKGGRMRPRNPARDSSPAADERKRAIRQPRDDRSPTVNSPASRPWDLGAIPPRTRGGSTPWGHLRVGRRSFAPGVTSAFARAARLRLWVSIPSGCGSFLGFPGHLLRLLEPTPAIPEPADHGLLRSGQPGPVERQKSAQVPADRPGAREGPVQQDGPPSGECRGGRSSSRPPAIQHRGMYLPCRW
jgi:hypothetical protein